MGRTLRIAILALAMIAVVLGMIALYGRDLRSGTEITLKTEPVDPRSLFLGHYATLGYAINRLDETIVGDHCYEANDFIFVTLEPDTNGEWRAVRSAPAMPSDGFAERRVTLRGRLVYGSCAETAAKIAAEPPATTAPAEETSPEEALEPSAEGETAPGASVGEETTTGLDAEPFPEPAPFAATVWISYGVEQYFASPEAARKLEDLARRRPAGEDGEPPPAPIEIILSVPRSGRALIKGVVIDGVRTYDQTLW